MTHLVSILLSLLVIVESVPGPFNSSRLFYVDKAEGLENYLFRSGSPLNNSTNSFAYEQIINQMRNQALKSGYVIQQNPYIIDISLLDPKRKDDMHCITVEKDYFNSNPENGRFELYPIYGTPYNPKDFHGDIRRFLALNLDEWTHDKLQAFISYIRQLLYTKQTILKPIAILIHCSAGIDRTGEVIGSYQMQYQNVTYDDFVTKDTKIAGHPAPATDNRYNLHWYKYYLE